MRQNSINVNSSLNFQWLRQNNIPHFTDPIVDTNTQNIMQQSHTICCRHHYDSILCSNATRTCATKSFTTTLLEVRAPNNVPYVWGLRSKGILCSNATRTCATKSFCPTLLELRVYDRRGGTNRSARINIRIKKQHKRYIIWNIKGEKHGMQVCTTNKCHQISLVQKEKASKKAKGG